MTANNNGSVRLGPDGNQNVGNTILGVVPNSNLAMTMQGTLHVTMGMTIDDLEIAPYGQFVKLVKDTNPTSPSFGQVVSQTLAPITWDLRPTWPYFILAADDFGNEISPHRYFFEDREGLFDPLDRHWSNKDTVYQFDVQIAATVVPPGSYQAEIILSSQSAFCGKLLLTLEVQDVDQMFQGDPSVVWYHLV